MLTPESFALKTTISPDVHNVYLDVINDLREEAEEKGNEIQFILPLMIWGQDEFNIDMSVFAELPEALKWTYSNEFLINMHNHQYLSDPSHLNSKGAAVYSRELSDHIKKRFVAQHPF
jgi:lysophospholipase L1-like esterase